MQRPFSESKTLLLHLVTVAVLLFSCGAGGEETGTAPEEITAEEQLPAIEAKAYDVKIIRPSKSGRVYLLQKTDHQLPDEGRIFLLRDSGQAVMGFRVLKVYPENDQVAAKKVREYPGHEVLPEGSVFRAYEKVGDILTIPPRSNEDTEDLKDLETPPTAEPSPEPSSTPEPSPEPSSAPSPEPSPEASPPAEAKSFPGANAREIPADFQDDSGNAEINENDFREEGNPDYFPNWLTFEFGLIRHGKLPGATYQKGMGLMYGRDIAHNIFLNNPDYPDLFTVEGGFYYFKVNGLDNGVAQSYTMLPIKGQLRYLKPLSEGFSFYLYGGLIYHHVLSHVNVTQRELDAVMVPMPAAGIGGLIQFGPNWYIKLNLGLDTIGAGISLRF